MKFLVVIPTIRQGLAGFDETIRLVRESFTQPTEFHVLDGRDGKAQTMNRALEEIARPSDADVYVTMDDDYRPGPGWQDLIAKGFEKNKRWGALAIWLGDHDSATYYMLAHYCGPIREVDGLRYRNVPHNLTGCMIAFRREVALKVGPYPPTPEKYQVWEDGYRCARVKKLGYKMAYLMGATPELVDYDDTPEYKVSKEADLQQSIPKITGYMRAGGVGPSLWTRLVGRAKREWTKLTGRKRHRSF